MAVYILRNGEPQGPYQESVVAAWLIDGTCAPQDLAWRNGMATWQPLSSIPLHKTKAPNRNIILVVLAGLLILGAISLSFIFVQISVWKLKENSVTNSPIAINNPTNELPNNNTSRVLTVQAPSQWEGSIKGKVANEPFRLPIAIRFTQPRSPHEKNPIGFYINAGDFYSQIGSIALASSHQVDASGGRATLQYFTVDVDSSQIRGVLVNEHTAEAGALNQFVSANTSAQNAPPGPAQHLQEYLSAPPRVCAFYKGAVLTMNLSGERLAGTIEGTGRSVSIVFTGDVSYQAEFVATRVR